MEITKLLLENGGDPTGTNSGGMPVLTQVIMKHDEPKALALARLLVDHGAVVTAGAASGSTPLHAAICRQHKQIVEWLLEKGADPNATCKECDPPLCLALEAEDIRPSVGTVGRPREPVPPAEKRTRTPALPDAAAPPPTLGRRPRCPHHAGPFPGPERGLPPASAPADHFHANLIP